VIRDCEEGPERSKRQHFEERARFVNKASDDAQISAQADELMRIDYSIHFHVWTQAELFELLAASKKTLGLSFDVELFLKNEHECIYVIRKGAPAA
jgi:hypothetical protein